MNDKRILKWFHGFVETWVDYVNKNGIEQNQISACNTYTYNGSQYITVLYWE